MIRNAGRRIPLVRSLGKRRKPGQMATDRQTAQRDVRGIRRGRSPSADLRSEENFWPFLIPKVARSWRSKGEYMSENVISNRTKRTVVRKCHALGNNWHDLVSEVVGRFRRRASLNSCSSCPLYQIFVIHISSAEDAPRFLLIPCEHSGHHSGRDEMETRKRARLGREEETERSKVTGTKDKGSAKDKGIAKEDVPDEVWEVPDTSVDADSDSPGLNAEEWERYAMGVSHRSRRSRRIPARGRRRRANWDNCGPEAFGGLDPSQGNSRGSKKDNPESSRSSGRKARRTMEQKIQRAERAYMQNTNPRIRRIIQNLEEEALQAQSEPEMEEWELLVQDPGNTRGRMSLFKQTLHLYWGMKRLLAKALEQVALEVVEITQEIPNLRRDLRVLQISMDMQGKQMEEIHQMLQASLQKWPREDSPILANAVG